MPSTKAYEYTFDNLAKLMERFIKQLGLSQYSLYLIDYGVPVGYRLANQHPERVEALVVQNGNAYVEGLREFLGFNPQILGSAASNAKRQRRDSACVVL